MTNMKKKLKKTLVKCRDCTHCRGIVDHWCITNPKRLAEFRSDKLLDIDKERECKWFEKIEERVA